MLPLIASISKTAAKGRNGKGGIYTSPLGYCQAVFELEAGGRKPSSAAAGQRLMQIVAFAVDE
jgi:hypothetical protein